MTYTILIADDEPSLRLLVKASLAVRKYTIIEVANGQDALNLAKQVQPDLVLLDVMMPFLTGFQVCEEMRKDPKTAKIPVIILTAKGGQDDRELANSVGASHFLTKPFRPPELLAAVDMILNQYSQQTQQAVSPQPQMPQSPNNLNNNQINQTNTLNPQQSQQSVFPRPQMPQGPNNLNNNQTNTLQK